jgi:hypothetical protein
MAPLKRIRLCAALLPLLLLLMGLGARPPEPDFPPRIGQLTLTKVVNQQAAQDSLDSIHDEAVPVAQAAIAHYEGQGGGAVVWWSRASSEAHARDQLERMVAKIRRGPNYPYGGYRQLQRRGLIVHSFLGHGQTHYTYRKGDQLYWITAPARLIEPVFDALMK